uniref:Ovule protein n=1 Tax=Schistosoma curassoni TaxID=6186 RepID=A0A183K9C8_9TREM
LFFSICAQVLNFHSLRKTSDLNKASRIKNILIFVVYKNKILTNILIQKYKIWSIQLYRDYVYFQFQLYVSALHLNSPLSYIYLYLLFSVI